MAAPRASRDVHRQVDEALERERAAAANLTVDQALEVRDPATTLALAVVGLDRECEEFSIHKQEIARRVGALAVLAAEVLIGLEKLDAAMAQKEGA